MALDKEVSYSGQNKVDTLSSKVRLEEGKGRLVAFNGQNNVGLFGYDDAGDIVVKVAKPGFDANSATDDQLIFNSNQNILKIITSNIVTIPAKNVSAGSFATDFITIPHGLPEPPLVQSSARVTMFFLDSSLNVYDISGYTPLPYVATYPPQQIRDYSILTSVDEDNIYFGAFYSTEAGFSYNFPAIPIKYYILQETAN